MNELKDIVERLNGYNEMRKYFIVDASYDDESGTWSLKVRRVTKDDAQEAVKCE